MEETPNSARMVRFGSFELDQVTGELRKGGVRIKLQDQPFRVLAELTTRPGDLVTREELREKLWPGDTYVEFDQNLNAVIKKVRQALGDSAENSRFIETLPKKGYRFVYPVEGAGDGAAAPAPQQEAVSKAEGEVEPPPDPVYRARRRWIAGIGIAVLVTFSIVIGSRLGLGPAETSSSPSGPKSIAVLPLENLSGDPGQEYFADGMTDMLITDLGTISALRVISRTSVMQYKGVMRPLSEIGSELDVSHIVEGTVLREGDEVRIGVRLIEAGRERQVWGQNYQRPVGQVLTLQREIARAVADAVQVELNPSERAGLDRNEEVSPEALDAYLRGWEAMKRGPQGGGGFPKAVELFEEAIERSPNYARAYLAMGIAYNAQASAWAQHNLTSVDAATKARWALAKALEIDDRLAGAHKMLAEIRRHLDHDWDGAEEGLRRALALNPNSAHIRIAYGRFLRDMGRFKEATRQMTLARRLDPHSPSTRLVTSATPPADWRISDLESLLETELATFHLVHIRLGEAYLSKGLHDKALAALNKAREMSDDNLSLAALGRAYAITGKTREAHEILDELLQRSQQRPVSSDHFARVYVGLGDKDSAVDSLEKAYDERAPALTSLKWVPFWDPLRSHPRFQALLKKMNFPELSLGQN